MHEHAEIVEALMHMNTEAKRAPHVMGSAQWPSLWDKRHSNIDSLLDALEWFADE